MNPDLYAGLTPEQEEKEMLKFRRFLSDAAEQMVLAHRTAVQTRKADALRNQIKSCKRYDLMTKHLDELIEEDILYFNAQATDGTVGANSASIRALYRAKQRKLKMKKCKKRQKEAKNHNCHNNDLQESPKSPRSPRTPKVQKSNRLTGQGQPNGSTPQTRQLMQGSRNEENTPAGSSLGFTQLHEAHQQTMRGSQLEGRSQGQN